jgi:hypothetical protein
MYPTDEIAGTNWMALTLSWLHNLPCAKMLSIVAVFSVCGSDLHCIILFIQFTRMLGLEILPVRFLFLISHLILTIFVLWARVCIKIPEFVFTFSMKFELVE